MLAAAPARAADIFSEVRLGVLAHDVKASGGREHGVDINGELLFNSPVPQAWAASMPAWAQWMLRPRPNIGLDQNISGFTSQYYFGLIWTAVVARNVFSRSDGLFFEIGVGPAWNNGQINGSRPDREALGSHVLIHPQIDLGYQINPRWSAMVYFDHSSNGHLAKYNESLNDVGLRFGLRF